MKWWLLILALLVLPTALANDQTLEVNITEHGKITNYLNTYWVVQVNGTGHISNPSDLDLFDVRLFFDILNLDLIDGGGDGRFDDQSLFFDRIPGGGEADFSYTIVGITTEPPTLRDKGVLYTGLAKRTPRIYSDVFGQLQKAPLEDPSVTNRDARLVSVTLDNPTQFQFTIESLRVIKTSDLDPNNVLDDWLVVEEPSPRVLDPDGFFVHDILDKNATEGEVYWLDAEVFISRVDIFDSSALQRYTEQNLTVPVEDLNFTNETDNITRSRITEGYGLRKRISDSVAVPGQPITVTLLLSNYGERLRQYQLTDALPAGFSASSDLAWSGEVPARNTVVVSYDAVLNDTATAGFDVFPAATAVVEGRSVHSDEVPFVRQFVPDDKVYVQKRVTLRGDDQAVVTISVENLGKNALSGASLKEFLEEDDLFSEITAAPESKGVWQVPAVAPGDSWSVEYVTQRGDALTRLPMLFGAPRHTVLRSIVLENVVSEAWSFVRTNLFELAGMVFVVVGPVVFLAGRRYNWF